MVLCAKSSQKQNSHYNKTFIKIHTELNTDKPLISQISRYHGYLRVKHTELNTDKPLISQISRFLGNLRLNIWFIYNSF